MEVEHLKGTSTIVKVAPFKNFNGFKALSDAL